MEEDATRRTAGANAEAPTMTERMARVRNIVSYKLWSMVHSFVTGIGRIYPQHTGKLLQMHSCGPQHLPHKNVESAFAKKRGRTDRLDIPMTKMNLISQNVMGWMLKTTLQ